VTFYDVDKNIVSIILIEATTSNMKQELIPSSIIHYMVGFTYSLFIKSI